MAEQNTEKFSDSELDPELGLDDQNPDKAEEYFKTKQQLKTLRSDLRDLKDQHERNDEIKELSEKLRRLRSEVANQEDIRALSDKISTLKERMDLLKDIIKMELIESEQEEVKREGYKLKLIQTLKEMRDEEL